MFDIEYSPLVTPYQGNSRRTGARGRSLERFGGLLGRLPGGENDFN
jgi:hypothetical protein